MSRESVAAALARAESVFRARPGQGLHDDAPATVRWQGDTRMLASHEGGFTVETDMPRELGGTDDRVTSGWLFRAGVAPERLRAIVDEARSRSPIGVAVEAGSPIALAVEVGEA